MALGTAAALAGAIGALTAQVEAKTDSRVLPLDKAKRKLYGYTAAEWTVQWWQWLDSIPAPVNPIFDLTGEFVEVGQRGPVWFLCGVLGISGAVSRTATIPAGKALFFPLVNYSADNVGVEFPRSVDELRADAAGNMNAVDLDSLEVTLDGQPVGGLERGRVQSDAYTWVVPEDNLFLAVDFPAPKGIYAPAVSDGFWVMLKPLSVGTHTLHCYGTVGPPINFTSESTYYLTVVESNRP